MAEQTTSTRRQVVAEHIGIVFHDFSTGGTERIAIRLAREWAALGRRVTIFCGCSIGPSRALLSDVIAVIPAQPQIPRGVFSRAKLGRALAEPVRSLQPDIIFSPGNFHLPVVAGLSRTLRDHCPPLVCKLSNPLRRLGKGNLGQMIFEKVLNQRASRVAMFVAMADSLSEEARLVLGRIKVIVIPEPILDQAMPRCPGRFRTGPPTIVCAGRLEPQKNLALAIRAFARLDPHLGARLTILGEGPDRHKLMILSQSLGVNDRVSLPGYVRDIRPALEAANLFLLTSQYEGYPAVLVEALAAGVPIVTTRCSPAIDEIMMHSSFGEVVGSSPDELARGILSVLAGPGPDAKARDDLLDRHGIETVAQHYLDLFDAVMQLPHERDNPKLS